MDETQWMRIMENDPYTNKSSDEQNLIDILKRRTVFTKYKPNGRTYARTYYLASSEDALHYLGSKKKSKYRACMINDITEIRKGLDTDVWRKCLKKTKVTSAQANSALSILCHNKHMSLDLLADTDEICELWIKALRFLIDRRASHMRTHREITDRWINHVFLEADVDKTGQLNRTEVRDLLFKLNIHLSEHDVERYFKKANIRANNKQESEHLDKDEFVLFYKYVAQRPELLEIICLFNGVSQEEVNNIFRDYMAVYKLTETVVNHKTHVNNHMINFRKPRRSPSGSLKTSFRRRSASITPDNTAVSRDATKKNFLTIGQLQDFLREEQCMQMVSLEDCSRLIARFEPSHEGRLCEEMGVDGLRLLLIHDEFCIMNPDKKYRVYHDMTRPITDYFIATSHNTYMTGNQIVGECTAETYVRALLAGCRAVEIDCYDGPDMEPIVYHIHGLTASVKFREILNAIEANAFKTTPYPLFINIENHCSAAQQGVMAHQLREIFKDQLLSKPLTEDIQKMPSPEQLKHKILIRARPGSKSKVMNSKKPDQQHSDEDETHSDDMHPDFVSLIIYAQNVSFTDIPSMLSTRRCFHSSSLSEAKVNGLIGAESPNRLGLIALTQHNVIRVYPGGKRMDSSNLFPMSYWTYGIQMVALNYQANDESMLLQRGFFSDNGGCGYLLKPACLLANHESFHPKEEVFKTGKRLCLRIISGQHLPKRHNSMDDNDITDPYVTVRTYGIERDVSKETTPVINNNGLNPIWDHKITMDICCPELCLVSFQVWDKNLCSSGACVGEACIPFNAIQPGYRHIKLKAENGDDTPGTIFVHVKIENL